MPFIKIMPYPLKCLGGKAQLIEQLVAIIDDCIERHNLVGVIDACMGGNRIFLTHHPEKELELKIANEKDIGLVKFFRCLQDSYLADQLVDEVWGMWDLYANETSFTDARKRRRDPGIPMVESAALTYIITEFSRAADRQNFSEANANRGIDPESLDKLLHLDGLLEDVEIRHGDCFDVIQEYAHRTDVLLFADPPYVKVDEKTGEAIETLGYEDPFTLQDHEKLLDYLITTKNKVILCGYKNPIYKRRLEDDKQSGFKDHFVGLVNVSSSSTGRKQEEFIWCNFDFDEDLLPEKPSDDDY
ncbi:MULTISPECIES: hypothetical protein [unclassified Lysinibacillus]|uniref:hypothetical protein n=1 Tax=unclassified Lysinibacillus TaxID=2636778 RepID=UPI003811A489